jgi:hypothetical protein
MEIRVAKLKFRKGTKPKNLCTSMSAAARPTEDLRDLLLKRACSRASVSKRVSIALFATSALLVAVSVWSAVYLDSKVSTNALYGLMVAYIVVFVLTACYTSYNSVNAGLLVYNPSTAPAKVRAWHKKGYKLLSATVIIEHCLIFCSLPIVMYHALGLSLSRCLFGSTCTGISYNTWETVSSGSRARVQQLVTKPVSVRLSTAQLGMFGCFIGVLGVAIIATGLYWFGESLRRPAASETDKKKPLSSLSSFSNRSMALYIMMSSSVLALIFTIISLAVIRTNWFVISLALSALSLIPLYRLRTIFREPRITRLQFRHISQMCLALLFIWLYVSGTGSATYLLVNLPLYTADGSSDSTTLIIDSTSIAQLVSLLVAHFVFSGLSAIALYVHLSLIDILESFLKTDETGAKVNDPVVVEDCPTPIQRQRSGVSWNAEICASCCTNKNNTVLVPCGHSVICSDCARALLGIPGFRCPLCCVEVFDSQKIQVVH